MKLSRLYFRYAAFYSLASDTFTRSGFLSVCKSITHKSRNLFILKFTPIFASPAFRVAFVVAGDNIASDRTNAIFNKRHFAFLLRPRAHGFKTLGIIASLALSACSTQPIVQIERINTPVYLPVPATLTAPVKVDLYPGITWGEAVGSLYSWLQSCNADKAAIGSLKPPNAP